MNLLENKKKEDVFLDHSYIINNLCGKKNKEKKGVFFKEVKLFYNDSDEIFKFMLTNTILDIEYMINCDGEDYEAYKIMQEKCICGERVETHENIINYYCLRTEFKQYINQINRNFIENDSSWEANKGILDEIKNEDNVVPFIGSGLSIPFGFPSWSSLVEKYSESSSMDAKAGIQYNRSQNNYVKCFDILIDDKINQKVKSEEHLKMLISKNFSMQNVKLNIRNNYSDILSMSYPLIFTTNYDEVLDSLGSDSYNSIIFKEIEEISSVEREDTIIHLHGSSRGTEKRHMVVTGKDYDDLYSVEDNKRKLQSLLGNKAIFFIGYSLDDYYFMRELIKISNSNRNFVNYYSFMINVDFEKLEHKISEYYNLIKIINIQAKGSDEIIKKIGFYLSYIKNEIYFEN